jgi:choline-sulfatase
VVDKNVSHCDLFATLCDLAGIPVPEGLDSRSLAPLLQGNEDGWDNEAVSQFGHTNVMIKRDQCKYQWYGTEMPEVLFDLERNPGETVNYIDVPEYAGQVAAFRARLAELGHGPNARKDA